MIMDFFYEHIQRHQDAYSFSVNYMVYDFLFEIIRYDNLIQVKPIGKFRDSCFQHSNKSLDLFQIFSGIADVYIVLLHRD